MAGIRKKIAKILNGLKINQVMKKWKAPGERDGPEGAGPIPKAWLSIWGGT